MAHSITINSGLQAPPRIIFPKQSIMKTTEASIADKRMAVLERSVYLEGVKVLQKQERMGSYFMMGLSVVLLISLFVVMRTI